MTIISIILKLHLVVGSLLIMKKNLVIGGIIAVVVIIGVALFFQSSNEWTETSQPESNTQMERLTPSVQAPETEIPTASATPDTESEVKTFTVEAKNFSFSLPEIKVNENDKVKIVLVNKQGFHDWINDLYGAKTEQIQANETAEVEFVADKTGTSEYYCSVGQHRAMGMKGNLIVE